MRSRLPKRCKKTVTVEADSREEAERQVEESWNNSEYILDADSFVGVDFSAGQTSAAVNMSDERIFNDE